MIITKQTALTNITELLSMRREQLSRVTVLREVVGWRVNITTKQSIRLSLD